MSSLSNLVCDCLAVPMRVAAGSTSPETAFMMPLVRPSSCAGVLPGVHHQICTDTSQVCTGALAIGLKPIARNSACSQHACNVTDTAAQAVTRKYARALTSAYTHMCEVTHEPRLQRYIRSYVS